jgi:hypothetical protein
MKKIIALLLTLSAPVAWADGNLAHQAEGALTAALTALQKTEPEEHLYLFKSVSAQAVEGHEAFAVTIGFSDSKQIQYDCAENESVKPVIWVCAKK